MLLATIWVLANAAAHRNTLSPRWAWRSTTATLWEAALRSQSEQLPQVKGVVELLKVPVFRRRGLHQNDTNFSQKSPAESELQGAAASHHGVPETRPGRIPLTDRLGMAAATQKMQQGLKRDWPLALFLT